MNLDELNQLRSAQHLRLQTTVLVRWGAGGISAQRMRALAARKPAH